MAPKIFGFDEKDMRVIVDSERGKMFVEFTTSSDSLGTPNWTCVACMTIPQDPKPMILDPDLTKLTHESTIRGLMHALYELLSACVVVDSEGMPLHEPDAAEIIRIAHEPVDDPDDIAPLPEEDFDVNEL